MRGIAWQAKLLMEDHGPTLEADARRRLHHMQELRDQLDALVGSLLKYARLGNSNTRSDVYEKDCVAQSPVPWKRFCLKET